MKKLSLKSLTLLLALISVLALALTSCNSMSSIPVIQQSDTTAYIQHLTTVDTVYRHDSIFIREVIKGDTIYLTRTEYRDRWRTRLVHDTIHDTQYIEKVIEKPPERYVPKFYKWTTALLFIFLFILGVRIFIKLRLKVNN